MSTTVSQTSQTIAIDAMGGDFGPSVVVPAALQAMQAAAAMSPPLSLKFLFFGDEAQIKPLLAPHSALTAVSRIVHTDKFVANDEKPSAALRRKDTSMRLAIEAVQKGDAAAVVSAGNTGALMATAKLVLRCLPGISRPAIASIVPTQRSETVMLDLGANLTCDASILVQFALMGAVYARTVKGIDHPSVGLLNVGSEDMKGPDQVREAAAILEKMNFSGRYYGFIEGNDITRGTVDVVVTDGFTGNVALKVAEGVSSLIGGYLKESLKSSLPAMIGGALAAGALRRVKKKVDPRYYNGGMFLGLEGICVKSHGSMDAYGFSRAVLLAATLVAQGYNKTVAQEIAVLMAGQGMASSVAASALEEAT